MADYDPSTRPEWDRLNEMQAALYRTGKVNTPEYYAIVQRMRPITPPGYGREREDIMVSENDPRMAEFPKAVREFDTFLQMHDSPEKDQLARQRGYSLRGLQAAGGNWGTDVTGKKWNR